MALFVIGDIVELVALPARRYVEFDLRQSDLGRRGEIARSPAPTDTLYAVKFEQLATYWLGAEHIRLRHILDGAPTHETESEPDRIWRITASIAAGA